MSSKSSTTNVKLYHADIYMPEALAEPVFTGWLTYSAHAYKAAKLDRYGTVSLPKYFWGTGAQLVEVETIDDVPVKQVWRQKLDEQRDLVLAITNEGSVKTVWINLNHDEHKSLRPERYEQPQPSQQAD